MRNRHRVGQRRRPRRERPGLSHHRRKPSGELVLAAKYLGLSRELGDDNLG